MIKKLEKHGKGFAVVISKAMMKALRIDEHTKLEIENDGKQIIIKPAAATIEKRKVISEKKKFPKISHDVKVQKAFEKIMTKHSAAFKKLAKN